MPVASTIAFSRLAGCRNPGLSPENTGCRCRGHARLLPDQRLGPRKDTHSHPSSSLKARANGPSGFRPVGVSWEGWVYGNSQMISLLGNGRLNFTSPATKSASNSARGVCLASADSAAVRSALVLFRIEPGNLCRCKVNDAQTKQSIFIADMFKITPFSILNESGEPSPSGIIGAIQSTKATQGELTQSPAGNLGVRFTQNFCGWQFQVPPAGSVARGELPQ